MPNSYNALTTSGDIIRRHRRHRPPTRKQEKPRTSPRVNPKPRIRIKIGISVAAVAHPQRRSTGSKKNWTARRVLSRRSSSGRSYRSWRRLSARVTSATSPSWAPWGLRLLLLHSIIARPPRALLLRGTPLVGGECRWTLVSGRYDIPLFYDKLFQVYSIESITSMYSPQSS